MSYTDLCRRAAFILGDWPNTADGWKFDDAARFRALAELLDRWGKIYDADANVRFTLKDILMLQQWERDVLASDGLCKIQGAEEIHSLTKRVAQLISPYAIEPDFTVLEDRINDASTVMNKALNDQDHDQLLIATRKRIQARHADDPMIG
jgi:hypothetical protein